MPDLMRVEREIGASGIQLTGTAHYNIEDYNADLQGQAGMILYDKMRRSDGEIGGALARINGYVVAADWRIEEPEHLKAKSKPTKPGAKKKPDEITEFVRSVLMREDAEGLQDTWTDFIRQALLMLPFGFMAFEKVWGYKDGKHVYAKLAPRLPKSFYEFRFDGKQSAFSGAVQYVWNPRTGSYEAIFIPAEKLVLFVWGREGDNYWGKSILRNAYMHWDYKRTILWVDAASIERFGMGVLEMQAREGVTVTDEERDAAELAAKEFRAHQKQYLYTGPKFQAIFHHPPSGQSRAIESATYHDQQMSRSTLTEFMATGSSQTSGSRATVLSKNDQFSLALQATTNIIEDVVYRQLIIPLVKRNFGPQESYPRIRCEDLDKMTGDQLAEILKPLAEAKIVVPDKGVRDHVRSVLDLPEEDMAEVEKILYPPLPDAGANGALGTEGADSESTKKPPQVKQASMPMQGWMPWRQLHPHEQYAAFSDMTRYLDLEPSRIWLRTVKPERDRIISEIAESAAAASDAALARREFADTDAARARLERALFKDLSRVYGKGRKEMVRERSRQLSGASVEPSYSFAEDDDEDLDPTPKQSQWVKTIAQGFVGLLIGGMIHEAARVGLNARNSNRTAERQQLAIAGALQELSTPQLLANLGGSVNQAFINGRNEQAEALGGIETAYYSCVMDAGSCGPCISLDGEEHEPFDASYATPNDQCEGGDRCRCATIYVFRGAGE
jgi:hypothetical protein